MLKRLTQKKLSGFTVIELLMVVAIIAILASIAMAQFRTAQEKSRDARRMSDMREIQKALDLYLIDNGTFPIQTTALTITGSDAVSTALEAADSISETPTDPRHPVTSYTYQSNSGGSTYDLSFCLETGTIPNYSQGCGNTINP